MIRIVLQKIMFFIPLVLMLLNPINLLGQEVVEGQYLIKFNEISQRAGGNVSLKELKARVRDFLGPSTLSERTFKNFPYLMPAYIQDEQTKRDLLESFGNHIEYVEPVYKVYALNKFWTPPAEPFPEEPFDELRSNTEVPFDNSFTDKLWGLENSNDIDVDVLDAWKYSQGDAKMIVAIIDTGVDYNHPDLTGNMWRNTGEIAGNGIDDDGNGYVDDIVGYDFANNDGSPWDDGGHGTHVAGTIAANGASVKGVAPNVKIMALKFLGSNGSGSTLDAIYAIDYAIANGAKVINNSWGGGGYSASLKSAVDRCRDKGILFVVAAGNAGNNNDSYPTYPASYDVDNVLAVAAVDRYGKLASFSNYGNSTVHVGAPGVGIYSTYPGGGYATLNGTSMACPHVSGIAALAWSHDLSMTYKDIIALIRDNVDPMDSLRSSTIWNGFANVGNIYTDLMGGNPDPDPTPTPIPDPDQPTFDPEKVQLWMYKKNYGSKRLIRLYFKEKEAVQFDAVGKVTYELYASSIPLQEKTDASDGYRFSFYTSRASYTMKYQIFTKTGKVYYRVLNLNTK